MGPVKIIQQVWASLMSPKFIIRTVIHTALRLVIRSLSRGKLIDRLMLTRIVRSVLFFCFVFSGQAFLFDFFFQISISFENLIKRLEKFTR